MKENTKDTKLPPSIRDGGIFILQKRRINDQEQRPCKKIRRWDECRKEGRLPHNP